MIYYQLYKQRRVIAANPPPPTFQNILLRNLSTPYTFELYFYTILKRVISLTTGKMASVLATEKTKKLSINL